MISFAALSGLRCPVPPPLDPGFRPPILVHGRYAEAVARSGGGETLLIALERDNGFVSRVEMEVSVASGALPVTLALAERVVKFMLWSRGGWRIHVAGPKSVSEHLRRVYSNRGARKFDVALMSTVYERPFEVRLVPASEVPAEKESGLSMGGHLKGCRIGFDLGASDYKVAAVKDGEVVYSDEFPWNPKDQPDPAYHFHHIQSALHRAAAHLPRVDAIGGSTAGVVVDNRMRVASLFRAVPKKDFAAKAATLFERLQKAWNVPLLVMNDGDVTALAGAMSVRSPGMLGVAMGSSLAAGFLDPQGRLTGWLNELAFAPVDFNPEAAADEWSGDIGVGVQYFSQQAVNKLLPAAGIKLPPKMGPPERLKEVQHLMAGGDPRAAKIYETIGVYLGYTLPYYSLFYDYTDILILGRVTTGQGGDIVLHGARKILREQFPKLKIRTHVPDEKSRRVGQAVAAASIPKLGK